MATEATDSRNSRIPPHDIGAEQAVLGSVLIKPQAFPEVNDALAVDDFFMPVHREIFEAIGRLDKRGTPIDFVSLADELRAAGVINKLDGGEGYLLELGNSVPTAENVTFYTRQVKEKATARRLISLCAEAMGRAYALGKNDPVDEIVSEYAVRFAALETQASDVPNRVGDLMDDTLAAIEQRAAKPTTSYVQTHLAQFNRRIGGLGREKLIIVAAPPGWGKCLGLGTPVIRFDGHAVPVETVRVGDVLMGPDSRPRTVIGTTMGVGQLYRVTPAKGDSWVCNDAHVLTLVSTDSGEVRDVEIGAFLKESRWAQERHKQFRVPVEWQGQPALPLDPYFVGLWYGDGKKDLTTVLVSKPDPEVLEAMRSVAEEHGCTVTTYIKQPGGCPHHRISGKAGIANPVLDKLRAIYGDGSRLPRAYMLASRTERLQFLAGLLDSDGYLGGGFDFIQKNRAYSEDVCFLARSLGFAAYLAESEKGCQTGARGTYWRVSISGDLSQIPNRIPRKKAPQRKMNKDVLRAGIVITDEGIGQYAGFELDGDGRFLLGDFTVTHNSAWGVNSAVASAKAQVPTLYVSEEMGEQELIERALGSESGIETRNIHRGILNYGDWKDSLWPASKRIGTLPLWIYDKPSGIEKICAVIRRWAAFVRRNQPLADDKFPMLLHVVVDYIQLIKEEVRGRHVTQAEAIGNVSRSLKLLAKALKIPIQALSQLTREARKARTIEDEPKEPELHDLRGSGDLEQDADMVIFLWGKEPPEPGPGMPAVLVSQADIIVAKHRGGATGKIPAEWDRRTMTFRDRMKDIEGTDRRLPAEDDDRA